ncbi:MAG: sugar phosphate isomerase/epimerase family protein [Bacteroidota bacterium]
MSVLLFVWMCKATAWAQTIPSIGIVQDMQHDSLLMRAGFQCLVLPVSATVSPKTTVQDFQQWLVAKSRLQVPVCALNIFLPGDLKVVGPHVDEQAVLAYTEGVFQRCQQAGITRVVWGSGGSRFIPASFNRDTARAQFITVARKVSDQAQVYGVQLALENLNRKETNFINSLEEAWQVARAVNRPNFGLCADIYHMLMENEPATVIQQAGHYVLHVDIAENTTRTPPGTGHEDFATYLKALHNIGYSGPVVMECRWEDVRRQALPARNYLNDLLIQAYQKK